MHESIERPLTSEDRQRLLDLMPVPKRPPFPVVRFVRRIFEMACVLFAGCLLIAVKDITAYIVLPCIVVVFLLYWEFDLMDILVLRPQRYALEYRPVMEFRDAANAAQTIRVRTFEVSAVVQVLSDDQTTYLFDTGDGQTYWMDIGYQTGLLPGKAPEDWPNTRFEILKLPNYPKEIGPFCSGKKLRPRETVDMDQLIPEGLDLSDVISPEGFINQPLDAFLAELKAQSAQSAK